MKDAPLRHDWTLAQIEALHDQPFTDLMFQAQTIHRQYFLPNAVQISTLLSIKTGSCPEDCAYCPQSGHYNTGLTKQKLLPLDEVIKHATDAKASGASRFCMGAAWRSPSEKDLPEVIKMVKAVKDLGLETCVTLGMLNAGQAQELKEAGLDYYNHNLDTSPEYYEKIITTRTYQERLDTLGHVRDAGIHTCCGGIVGMGEGKEDRLKFLQQLANLPAHPDSVPINKLISVQGTPLGEVPELPPFEFVRMIALSRIMMPKSYVRLSAGREDMSDELQALCFLAGANSIFYGEKLLTTDNPSMVHDQTLFRELGMVTDASCCA